MSTQRLPEDTYLEAHRLIGSKHYKEAVPYLVKLLHEDKYHLRALSNIGGCLLQMGHIRSGLKFVERALNRDPSYIPAVINQAEALRAMNDVETAASIYEDLSLNYPSDGLINIGLAKAYMLMKKDRQALETLEKHLSLNPTNVEAILLKGEIQSNLDDHLSAIRTFGDALACDPKCCKALTNLGVVMVRINQLENAITYFTKALELEPDSQINLHRKAQILFNLSRVSEARSYYAEAHKSDQKSAALFLNRFLLIPGIPTSTEEIETCRETFVRGLELAEKEDGLVLDLDQDSLPHTFSLAYHNKNDRFLLERYINLMRRLAAPLLEKLRQERDPYSTKGRFAESDKVKIGFLSQYFSKHSNTLAFEGLIQYLDRSLFEVYLIHTYNSKRDDWRDRLDRISDHSIVLTKDLAGINNTLCSLELDILFFTDIGMNSYDFLFPLLAAAPIQLTGWGIPHTSGISEIDYYISCDKLEPPDADDLYTEKLVKLPGGIPCCFISETLDYTYLPREYFILPPSVTLIGCLQSFHKLHPDFDNILEEIAIKNPDVGFVFVEDASAARTKMFLERLSKNAPTAYERYITLALMNRAEYHALCACMDILLDPIYYGSGITFFEASFVGTPIVTLEGGYLRSRVVACGYREMEIADKPIASTKEEYVHIVTSLVQDRDRRMNIRESILKNNYRVFNRVDYVRSFEKFCLSAVERNQAISH
ncbi:tetratricopeptide repeat protein [Cyanobium gracile UHCC 0139]|uniref:protein O-GlcNAc transferase n=1 Tax=Cyanobium gracile UHCC 0139 TaxID=3110308 RepID=A0ABU5RUV5_9CYAN|nr:tetratricopeptide repeat protein [Cyanobium gracile]MEA5391460.1 tetratricopeptide repeat protein [Cyanobium gracile UHCC 0139]